MKEMKNSQIIPIHTQCICYLIIYVRFIKFTISVQGTKIPLE